MPQNRNSSEPPPVMTWRKAAPVLVIAALSDILRFMFTWLVFFGPALAGIFCTVKTGSTIVGSICATAAGAASYFGIGFIEPFGLLMAMITGLAGWMITGVWLLTANSRIFKENRLWFGMSLLGSEIPFINSLPLLSGTMWRMYRTQIKVEKAAYKKWEKETRAARLKQQNEQAARAAQIQAVQPAQLVQNQENELAMADV